MTVDRRRALQRAALLTSLLLPSRPVPALMAGLPPDSVQARLDPNTVDSPFASVCSVKTSGGVYSAVIVADRWALTASHVTANGVGVDVLLNLGSDLSHRLPVEAVVHCPPLAGRDGASYRADLALLRLAARVPAELILPRMAHGPAYRGQRLELAGYGDSGPGNGTPTQAAHPALRRRGANLIEQLESNAGASDQAVRYLFVFDPPSLRKGQVLYRTQSLGNAIETGLARGDSGSGAFVLEGGDLRLLGINTFVARRDEKAPPAYGFGTAGGGELIGPHRAWMEQITNRTWD